jgi:hypothetical protein
MSRGTAFNTAIRRSKSADVREVALRRIVLRGKRAGRKGWAGALLLGLLLAGAPLLGGCRTSLPQATGTTVASGETITGRMVAGRREQAFTFEGVESSLVDFTVQADRGNQPAPMVEVLDPEGRTLDVAGAMRSTQGSATVKVVSLVLPRTGTYKVIARPSAPLSSECETVFYRFSHCLRFAPIDDRRAYLSADNPRPVYVSAPRGGLVVVNIDPCGGDLQPDILGVKDPWGGPALDRSLVPAGALPPRVSHMQNRTMILTFTAPRPGMYTILAGAKPCKPGVGSIHVEVRAPKACARTVYHDNSQPGGFGVPGALPTAQPTAACPPVCPAPPPPPAPCAPPCVVPPTTSPDPALATR